MSNELGIVLEINLRMEGVLAKCKSELTLLFLQKNSEHRKNCNYQNVSAPQISSLVSLWSSATHQYFLFNISAVHCARFDYS